MQLQVSMFPLLERDGLTLPYFAMLMIWAAIAWPWACSMRAARRTALDADTPRAARLSKDSTGVQAASPLEAVGGVQGALALGGVGVLLVLHAGKELFPPPEHLPWLYDRIFTTVTFVGLALIWAGLQVAQWGRSLGESDGAAAKKRL